MLEIKPYSSNLKNYFKVYWKNKLIGYLFRIASQRLDKTATGWEWGRFSTGKWGVCKLRRDAIAQIRKK